jgi:YidC/Oxa1 family membrane protein insertase
VIISLANIFQPLVDVFEWILLRFHDVLGSWGWSIIGMTVLVRACLLPLTFKQFKSMQALASHAPEMKKLQDRYKNDKERLNQEMMKFYRENKINPFASCLPLAAQLPVFLSLFYMLRTDLRFDICPEVQTAHGAPPAAPVPCGPGGDAQFLFIPDLTNKATGAVLAVLIVLYVGSQLFSTLLMSTTTDRTQRMIFLALPFLFVTFVVRFPAGLLVYWITTNLWTIVQQSIIRKRLGPMRPPGQEGMGLGELLRGAGAGGGGGGGGGSPGPAPSGGASNGGGRSGGRDGKAPEGRPTGPPPAPPRRKKKRSGRRR